MPFRLLTYYNRTLIIKLSDFSQTFNLVLHTMAGSDAYPVWLNQVIIGALPVAASRHNSPSHPHFLHKLVCSHLPGGDACIVVSRFSQQWLIFFFLRLYVMAGCTSYTFRIKDFCPWTRWLIPYCALIHKIAFLLFFEFLHVPWNLKFCTIG